MKLSSIQKLIIYSTILFILSARACKYLFSKNIQPVIESGNYWTTTSIFSFIFFIVSILVLIASIIGFIKIIKRLFTAHKSIIVKERLIAFFINCLWTFIISVIAGLFLKVLIWP